MREWILSVALFLAVLAVGYRYALPVFGSLYRQARMAWLRRQAIRRLARGLDLPPAVLRSKVRRT